MSTLRKSHESEEYALSGKRRRRKIFLAWVLPYACVSAFLVLFAQVYGLFSHGVSSASMTYAFAYPAVLGCGAGLLWLFTELPVPGALIRDFYTYGTACLTVGSLLRGVYEIAGTASVYQEYLSAAGWILTLAMLAAGGVSSLLAELWIRQAV